MTAPIQPFPCPSCGTSSAGKYCPDCGAALLGASCATCHKSVTPGAKFCHHCGAAAGPAYSVQHTTRARSEAARQTPSVLPWVAGGIAFLALVIVTASQQAKIDPAAGLSTSSSVQSPVRAPDISQLTPREQADRLYNRVMRLSSEGKSDSASFFASMAVGAYESLAPLDLALRYGLGRMAEIAGDIGTAKAQSDSILAQSKTHLLGLILAARLSELQGNTAMRQGYLDRARSARGTEIAKNLPEYERHQADIDTALAPVAR